MHHESHAPAHMAKAMHRSEDALGYYLSKIVCTTLLQIIDEQGRTLKQPTS